jgi:hypothetical protein
VENKSITASPCSDTHLSFQSLPSVPQGNKYINNMGCHYRCLQDTEGQIVHTCFTTIFCITLVLAAMNELKSSQCSVKF